MWKAKLIYRNKKTEELEAKTFAELLEAIGFTFKRFRSVPSVIEMEGPDVLRIKVKGKSHYMMEITKKLRDHYLTEKYLSGKKEHHDNPEPYDARGLYPSEGE